MKLMSDQVLTLTVEDNGLVRARTAGGAEYEGDAPRSRPDQDVVSVFDDWARRGKLERWREFEVFGSLLWRAVFPAPIERAFEERLNVARREGGRLRLQLSFTEPVSELARLPWEYLYRPATTTRPGSFLATDRDLVLTRYLPLDVDEEHLAPADPPLRLLVVTAAPEDLGPVMFAETIEAIEGLRKPLKAEITRLSDPTIDDFLECVEAHRPHVVHLIGHGRFDAAAATGAVALLEEDRRSARWLPDDQFAELFRQMRALPRLVVLHLCDGGRVEFDEDFAGVAPQLVRREVPAVVAMQYPITNAAATAFSRILYRELARESNVDDAVQAARWALTLRTGESVTIRDFGIPVLYMRSRDGVLKSAER